MRAALVVLGGLGLLWLGRSKAPSPQTGTVVKAPANPFVAAPSGWVPSDGLLRSIIQNVLTKETDPRVVLSVGALCVRNMLTVFKGPDGAWTFDRRPQYFNIAKLPLRDDLTLLPEPATGKPSDNPFQSRAFELMQNVLTVTASMDKSATKTFAQVLKGQ